MHPPRHATLFASILAAAATAGALGSACDDHAVIVGSSGSGQTESSSSGSNGGGGAATVSTGAVMGSDSSSGTSMGDAFDVQPAAPQELTVPLGQSTPTVTFQATFNGSPVNAGWAVDRGNIGFVPTAPASSATFTPTGATGGLAKVTAGLNGKTLEREVFVKLTGSQNGADPSNPDQATQIATTVGQLTAGGGVGGVGGEGLGVAVDPATATALGAPTSDGAAEALKFLYPYDKTVWPRGMLAPLLQWRSTLGDVDAVRIELTTTSGSFSWTGTFAKPAILAQTGKPFVRHPIPQNVWKAATNSAGGTDTLTVKLTVAKGGVGYGPISETWTIAPGRLSGIIYYNSYGTQLAKNYPGAVGGDHMFGGAVLSIHGGDTGPQLTAGANGASAQCRVCHSVSADGSRLIAQHGDQSTQSSAYDLTPTGSVETPLAIGAEFPGMYPDGSLALSPSGQLLPLPNDSMPLPVNGLSSVATNVGTPAFSADGKFVVFNPIAGPGVTNPTQKLLTMQFDKATGTFSNPFTIVDLTGQPAQTRPGWGAFFPDASGLVFHQQSAAGLDGNGSGALWTRKGARAHLEWAKVGTAGAEPLNALNGKDANGTPYVPALDAPVSLSCTGDGAQVGTIDTSHQDDVNLNYEPTVNPVASGGYVWVVFTSRRMYGSVATIPPFCSDPRGVDLVQNITPKKLWVAAIDLSAQPGTDPSHPAFYLPAQELLAGNSRGFWALDPCKADGQSCEAGDQCCGGYCQPDMSGMLVCSNIPPNGMCSQPQEKCDSAADCCDGTNLCINGFCAEKGPQ
ncbi:MAG: hypothetical protein U0414_25830 [Polyangiaceae bacterium]